ncbi:MAG: aminopeptidase P family protein [Actinobacteria bacterium]|nr:aminopeptidase P family protein [Actinomycetota bacterium]
MLDLDDLLNHDHEGRCSAAADSLPRVGVETLLVTDPLNIRYLTGFTGSAGLVHLRSDGEVLLVTDARYAERAEAECSDHVAVAITKRSDQGLVVRDHAGEATRIGLEGRHITWAGQREWSAVFERSNRRVVQTLGTIERVRLVKEAAEIERITLAASIADTALAQVKQRLTDGLTERQIKLLLERSMIDQGADAPAFDTIVASGPNGASPHHESGDRVITRGDLVIIDMGATVDGYRSDMTRTFSVGVPDAAASSMLRLVGRAQQAGVDAVLQGVSGDEVDKAARSVIAVAGVGDEFVHGVGHGVGLAIHEAPFLLGSDLPLLSGQVVTVEPGVYRAGLGGVRVEDTVVVTRKGCRKLTQHSLDPIVA